MQAESKAKFYLGWADFIKIVCFLSCIFIGLPYLRRMKQKIIIAVITMACVLHAGGTIPAEDRTMRAEADLFLSNLPVGLQAGQKAAIEKAIVGDCSELHRVRSSRNVGMELSVGVQARYVADNLRLYEPERRSDEALPLLIYLHGGGWTFGSINSCARFCDAMAATGRMKVLAVDYRLAPEYPYPCGLRDCEAALDWAVVRADELGIDPSRIVVGGDSSGGNLALATALNRPGVASGLLLFYPVVIAEADGSESWRKYGTGLGLDADLMETFNRAYAGCGSAADTRISVGLASDEELLRLPPILLIAAGRDILCDQGRTFADRFKHGGITRIEFPEAVHLFITVPGQSAAFRLATEYASHFVAPE